MGGGVGVQYVLEYVWMVVMVVVVGYLEREDGWMVCGYKKLFFPRENHVLALPCRGYSCSSYRRID